MPRPWALFGPCGARPCLTQGSTLTFRGPCPLVPLCPSLSRSKDLSALSPGPAHLQGPLRTVKIKPHTVQKKPSPMNYRYYRAVTTGQQQRNMAQLTRGHLNAPGKVPRTCESKQFGLLQEQRVARSNKIKGAPKKPRAGGNTCTHAA